MHKSETQVLVDANARQIDEQIQAKKIEVERELEALSQESEALMSQQLETDKLELGPKSVDVTLESEMKEDMGEEEALGHEPDDVELVDEEANDESTGSGSNVVVNKIIDAENTTTSVTDNIPEQPEAEK